jgi:phage terminase small subunit
MGVRGPRSIVDLASVKSRPAHDLPGDEPAPKHLRPETQAWWRMAVETRRFKEHELRMLLVTCETLDRREQAREALKKFGLTFTDAKGMVRQRPEVCIERDCSAAFLRAVRTLHLDPLPPDKRHPGQIPWYEKERQ